MRFQLLDCPQCTKQKFSSMVYLATRVAIAYHVYATSMYMFVYVHTHDIVQFLVAVYVCGSFIIYLSKLHY